MSDLHVPSLSRLNGHAMGTLLALVLLTGCSTRWKHTFPGSGDVCLPLRTTKEETERFRCGDQAVRQVIQYYHPEITDEKIRTDALLFVEANDTVSLLHCLKENVAIPLAMQNATVDRLLASLDQKDPVLVFVPGDLFAVGFPTFGTLVLHCIVVAGHNADKTELLFYSDGKGPYAIRRDVFARQWKRVDNLCIMRERSR